MISASYRLYDTDMWQFIATGKALWALHAVPQRDLWTWPGYGRPEVMSSWLFRAIVWPVWHAGGVPGLYALRWALLLTAFGFTLATARRLGARGFAALVALTWCALVYRIRTDIRPETLVAVLFAATLWILETRRYGGPDRAWWLVPIAWLWANAHISYYLAFVLIAFHLLDAHLAARRHGSRSGAPASRTRLGKVAVVAAAVAFANPFGARALWQPFKYLLEWRREPLFETIGELHPLIWSAHVRNGLPFLMLAWAMLLVWRWRRRGRDLVELACAVFFTAAALQSQRFLGVWALVAAPYLARDVQEWIESRPWPGWTAAAWTRAALAASACVVLCLPDWRRPELPIGIGIERKSYPAGAADFIAAHRVRGRAFNHFHLGGYLTLRFWPDQTRLPFMTTQPEISPPEDRAMYVPALTGAEGWRALDGRHRFDYVVLDRNPSPGDRLADQLDADSTWALVFIDDAAEVLVRRGGPLQAVADSFAYRLLPAGHARRQMLIDTCGVRADLRADTERELRRQVAASGANGTAHHLLGLLLLIDGKSVEAQQHLERALALEPMLPRIHEMLAYIALEAHRPFDALRELEAERRTHDPPKGLDFKMGQAYRALGDLGRARASYARELTRDPGNTAARDSLGALPRP